MADWEEFTAPLVDLGERYLGMGVIAPFDVAARYGRRSGVRIAGTVAGQSVQLAFNSMGDGRYYLRVGKALQAKASLQPGALVHVRYQLADPDAVDVPAELLAALEQEPEAQRQFDAFRPGRKRSLSYYVSSAKTEGQRIDRALELVQGLLANGLQGWPPRNHRR